MIADPSHVAISYHLLHKGLKSIGCLHHLPSSLHGHALFALGSAGTAGCAHPTLLVWLLQHRALRVDLAGQ